MEWLYQKGVSVKSSDLAEETAIKFVKKNPQLVMSRTEALLKNSEQTVVYETPDKRLKIYVCTFELMTLVLIEYWDKLHPTDNFTHIYVPLCGKTVDMRWLYQKGVSVVGGDFVEEAAVEFVKEHPQLAMSRTEITLENGEQTVVYETPNKRLKIYVCRFESMPFTGEKFDMVWDRAAFVAVDPNMRQTFVESTFGLLKPDFRWLQESIEYPPVDQAIPPHSVSDVELENLFGTHAKVQLLWRKENPRWRGLPWCNRRAMLYSPLECPAS